MVELYGQDTRYFLVASLFQETDLRDLRGVHNNPHKLQLLAHELTDLATRPEFASVLHKVRAGRGNAAMLGWDPHSALALLTLAPRRPASFASSLSCLQALLAAREPPRGPDGKSRSVFNHALNQDLIVNLSKVLKFSAAQTVLFALGLANGPDPAASREAATFIKARLPELPAAGAAGLPDATLSALALLVRTHDVFAADPKTQAACLQALAELRADGSPLPADVAALLEPLEDAVDLAEDAFAIEEMADARYGRAGAPPSADTLAGVVVDLGPVCTATREVFRDVLVATSFTPLAGGAAATGGHTLTEAHVGALLRARPRARTRARRSAPWR